MFAVCHVVLVVLGSELDSKVLELVAAVERCRMESQASPDQTQQRSPTVGMC